MAEDNKKVHYLVGTTDEPVQHIYASDQEAAVKEYVSGNNYNGYDVEEFDGEDVLVVAYSKVDVYQVTIEPPTEANVALRKVTTK